MNAEVSIRPLVEADIPALRALATEIWHAHYTAIIGAAQIQYMLAQRYSDEILRSELQRSDMWWDLLSVGGVPKGYAAYFLEASGDTLKLDKLYVHGACQRLGYGERLLQRVCERAREQGCGRIVLAVNKRNASAIAAYRKWGFEIEQAVVQDIGGGFVMDDYIMALSV
jgi:ribosomal protein S18 acetylase RimI-like enzyme